MTTPPKNRTVSLSLPDRSAQPVLTIDLGALAANYQTLQALAPSTEIAGVVKADGYGCGAVEVAERLVKEGCKTFFVTNLEEALELRASKSLRSAQIYVFNGCFNEDPNLFLENNLTPILNRVDEVKSWLTFAGEQGETLAYGLHLDTGMNRQGINWTRAGELADLKPTLVMSHLASADQPDAPFNEVQRQRFEALSQHFPGARKSLANSAGLHLGSPYHYDLARPGIALYGGEPLADGSARFEPVVHLYAPILQIREIAAGETVGYGETFKAGRKTRIATLPLGYADGIHRSLSNAGFVYFGEQRLPVVGRVSMDLITVDVTDVEESLLTLGSYLEILGSHISVDDLGRAAGTFGYEVLTSLGTRYQCRYLEG